MSDIAHHRPLVLIVEDEQGLRLLLETLIEGQGYGVISAGDGETALLRIRQERPDLMLLDLGIPGRSGLEVLREIKEEDSATASLPVMVVSAYARLLAEEDARLADALVDKPFDPDVLLARVDHLLAKVVAA